MRGFLCTAFIDFAATRLDVGNAVPEVSCEASTCLGPAHLRSRADALAAASGDPAPELLRLFGTALFGRLARSYPSFFVGIDSTVGLLARYETHVAPEVEKLDGTARPPHLTVRREGGAVEVDYRSEQGLAALAEGLLRGSILHFRESLVVQRSDRSGSPNRATFRLAERAARR